MCLDICRNFPSNSTSVGGYASMRTKTKTMKNHIQGQNKAWSNCRQSKCRIIIFLALYICFPCICFVFSYWTRSEYWWNKNLLFFKFMLNKNLLLFPHHLWNNLYYRLPYLEKKSYWEIREISISTIWMKGFGPTWKINVAISIALGLWAKVPRWPFNFKTFLKFVK